MDDKTRRHRRRALVVTAVGCVMALAAAPAALADVPTAEAQDVREYQVGPPSVLPESVTYDEGTNAFYGGALVTGVLYKATLDGAPAEQFLPPLVDSKGTFDGRAEAAGVEAHDGKLYVAGGALGRINVYDLNTRELVAGFETGPGGFINDVTVTANGDVFATDSFRPRIYRIGADRVAAGSGTPQTIDIAPEVNYPLGTPLGTPFGTSPKPFNANGIKVTPDGNHIVFGDLNDSTLYRLTLPEDGNLADREIEPIEVEGGALGDVDGLEFADDHTLYAMDNGGERVLKIALDDEYLSGTLESATTSPRFHTPTSASLAPEGRLLVSNAELFDPTEPGPPFFVTSIPRP